VLSHAVRPGNAPYNLSHASANMLDRASPSRASQDTHTNTTWTLDRIPCTVQHHARAPPLFWLCFTGLTTTFTQAPLLLSSLELGYQCLGLGWTIEARPQGCVADVESVTFNLDASCTTIYDTRMCRSLMCYHLGRKGCMDVGHPLSKLV